MRILQISKADSFGGGASRFAEDLSKTLCDEGYFCHHWVSWSGKGYDYHNRSPLYGSFERQIHGLRFITKKLGDVDYLPFELPLMIRRSVKKKYDLIHFHDISSTISPLTLEYYSRYLPIVWTAHDCSPFTGGCLYPMDCDRFKKSCGSCPQAGTWPIDSWIDTTRIGLFLKKRLHKFKKITCITPSHWMAKLAYSSKMFAKPLTVISNGIDTKIYKFKNKVQLRKRLGIPVNRLVILISALYLEDERKGVLTSLKAIKSIIDLNPFLIVLGIKSEKVYEELNGLPHLAPGNVSEQTQLSDYYRAADCFLCCSLADNQPISIMEAMMSGTPLVGFSSGGIKEMVQNNRTGYLVETGDMTSLCSEIRKAFVTGNIYTWSKPAHTFAMKNYNIQNTAKRYLELYTDLIREYHQKNRHVRT